MYYFITLDNDYKRGFFGQVKTAGKQSSTRTADKGTADRTVPYTSLQRPSQGQRTYTGC